MIRYFFILWVYLLFGVMTKAQGKNIQYFIPEGYDTLMSGFAKGDLNSDGMEDAVMVLYHKWENSVNWKIQDPDSMPGRLLVILYGTGSGYKKSAASSKAILCKSCGGIFGDPFSGIGIIKNVLEIYHYGGSAWRWALTHKFRFQKNAWYLIGQERNTFWTMKQCELLNEFAGTDHEDINFLTGQFERKRISEDCVLLENKKGRKKIQPLLSLTKFTIDN